jgi:hypothetical protein
MAPSPQGVVPEMSIFQSRMLSTRSPKQADDAAEPVNDDEAYADYESNDSFDFAKLEEEVARAKRAREEILEQAAGGLSRDGASGSCGDDEAARPAGLARPAPTAAVPLSTRAGAAVAPSTAVPRRMTMRTRRHSARDMLAMVSSVSEPLELLPTGADFTIRASALPHNALCVEIRDMYRIMDGLAARGEANTLKSIDVTTFYEWFEGFYGIVTAIFEVMEDVVFSWLEKIGAIKMEKALAPKRRKTKQTRTADICWDVLELKLQVQKSADKAKTMADLGDLVYELADEVEHLAMRLLTFAATLDNELPALVAANFEQAERDMMEEAMLRNLKASDPGKFVLGAFTRGIEGADARNEFLQRVFAAGKHAKKSAGLKEYKKFHTRHVDLADSLATARSSLTHRRQGQDTMQARARGAGDCLH